MPQPRATIQAHVAPHGGASGPHRTRPGQGHGVVEEPQGRTLVRQGALEVVQRRKQDSPRKALMKKWFQCFVRDKILANRIDSPG